MKAWKKDLDALVEQTMAFVKTVKTETSKSRKAITVPADLPMAAAILKLSPSPHLSSAKPSMPGPSTPKPADWVMSEREQISQRVATFKAHQEKLRLERDAFFNNTLASIRESMNAPRI